MTYSIVEPSIISISEDDWLDQHARDLFLEQLIATINDINQYKYSKLAWSTNVDNLIWSSPQQPPWKKDRCWSNVITPILYKIQSNNEYFDDELDDCCLINPDLYSPRVDLYNEFKRMVPVVHGRNTAIKTIIHIGFRNRSGNAYRFLSISKGSGIPLEQIQARSEYLKMIPVESLFWPHKNDVDASLKLEKSMQLIIERDFCGKHALFTFSFHKDFIKKLTQTLNDKLKILTSMAKRLTLTSAAARIDGAFQEERIGNEFRFRISQSKRIHISIENNNIDFLMFYDEGEHDDGL